MTRSAHFTGILFVAIFSALALPAVGQQNSSDRDYFSIDVGDLVSDFDKKHIVSDPEILEPSFYQMETTPRVVVPTGTEAYLLVPPARNNDYTGYKIVGSKPKAEAISGQFYLLRRHPDQKRESSLAKFDFKVDATPKQPSEASEFYRAKGKYFERLWSPDYAGAAMFRHLAIDSLKRVNETAKAIGPSWPLRRNGGVDDTIRLVSGGRAVSENLQLDRELAGTSSDPGVLKDISEVEGVTVREIDWTNRLSDEPTELDALAALVPHDQYAVFVPSFAKLEQIVDRSSELSRPIVQWFEPQSQTSDVLGFYQHQLGLPLDALTRQVGGVLIDEIAITGSDPYFRTGTDVAVLMRTKQVAILHQAILAQVARQSALHHGVKRTDHKVKEHVVTQWSNPLRGFSSFVTFADDAVVVSNSIHQIKAILNTSDKQTTSMKDLDEYKFFRQRYLRGSNDESALVVITDAAIRQWCGPKWRISASRRTRARASIAEVTMRHADDLIRKQVDGTITIHTNGNMPEAGVLTLTSAGVQSDQYGTLDFQTPIAELDLKTATTAEVDLYTGWRTRYQRRWRNVFDPIAIQLAVKDDSFAVDLSVIPLILGSEYRTWQSFIGNSRLKPDAGDDHEEMVASMKIAVDMNARQLQFASMFLSQGNAQVNLFSWVDDSIHLYVDHDDAWLQRLAEHSPWAQNGTDLLRDVPFGIFIPSKDNFTQALFITAARGFFARSAPNLVTWDLIRHKELEYVKATASGSTPIGAGEDLPQIFYVTLPDGLTISFNENVIRRAIDRHVQRKKLAVGKIVADTRTDDTPTDDDPTNNDNDESVTTDASKQAKDTGPQIESMIKGTGAKLLSGGSYSNGLRRIHRLSWGNIPILNHLRHRYPDREPAEVYEELFGTRLLEPSGGQYVWNDERKTYVSTLQGYHLEPKAGPTLGFPIKPNDIIESSLSFQDEGLRAKLIMTEEQGKP